MLPHKEDACHRASPTWEGLVPWRLEMTWTWMLHDAIHCCILRFYGHYFCPVQLYNWLVWQHRGLQGISWLDSVRCASRWFGAHFVPFVSCRTVCHIYMFTVPLRSTEHLRRLIYLDDVRSDVSQH
jgi:hypothetical protein